MPEIDTTDIIITRLCVCVCVCFACIRVCACVRSVSIILKIEPQKYYSKKNRQICERSLLSPSQDRDPEVSCLYEIAVKWLCTRVSNTCFHINLNPKPTCNLTPHITLPLTRLDTRAHRDPQIDTDARTDTNN